MTGTPSSNSEKRMQPKIAAAGGQAFTTLPTQEQIARRAYEIYLASGRKEGQSQQNWLQAERELLTEAVTLVEESPETTGPEEIAVRDISRFAPAFRSPRLRLTGSLG